MPDDLLAAFQRRDRRALARLLSLADRGQAADILARLGAPAKRSRVVALTGSAGVGKSTLIGKLLETARAQGQTVAVLACDPQSPLSGGALLGDRFRMPTRADDDGVYIRSIAAPGGQGAIATHEETMVRLLEAFGFDLILLETVGAGQGDTAVHHLADVVVLLLQPETGDEIQWEKAGVLEIADMVVVHKGDLPGAENVERQVLQALHLSATRMPMVLRVSSRTGEGVEELWRRIAEFPLRRAGGAADEAELLRRAQELLAMRFAQAQADRDAILNQVLVNWRAGVWDGRQAAAELLTRLGATSWRPGGTLERTEGHG